MRRGRVYVLGVFAGILSEIGDEFIFAYDDDYLKTDQHPAVSLTLPKRSAPYRSKTMFPFFDGLIPEGWLLDIVESNWKLDSRDRLGLLITVCGDCVGAVHIEKIGV